MWKLVIFIMLSICSYTDIKHKNIDIRILITAFIILLFLKSFSIYGIIPAILLLLLKAIKNNIGSGDIIIFTLLGLFLGINEIIQIMFVAFLLAAFYGIFILVYERKDKGYRLPFVPFIFAAYIIENIKQLFF